ncbi:MAG: acetylxylan esterase [Candidatus Hydrogenedentes bacterium]|nr:acetylxylan esterase [Candidatus Hydrogenedentota bacterium]
MPSEEQHLSPSLNHQHVMKGIDPKLAYSGGDCAAWRRRLRRRVRAVLGDTPAKRVPLNPRTLWKRDLPLGSVEKIIFTSEPYADVPAYFCLPNKSSGPFPVMICLQGHSTGMHLSIGVDREDETKPFPVQGDRDFALGCMARGFAALCIEQRSFGERRELLQERRSKDMCHEAVVQALLLGRTLVGERVYDVDRGLDYLESRPEVDMRRVGCMGNSGGATVTIYASALLPRICFAMPSCGFATYAGSILSVSHCADNYLPGMLKYADMGDVLGLFAPRPVVVVAGRDDDIFPLPAVREAFEQLERIYKAAGAEGHCHLVVGNGGHRFYAEDAWPVLLGEVARLA